MKVVTTQMCPVWSTTPKKSAEKIGDVYPGQVIEVAGMTPERGDLVLITWPDNLYPRYLGHDTSGYIEPAHVRLVGDTTPGVATLDSVMALLAKVANKLGVE